MKNRLGWPLATLAILTFSFGQATAAAGQVLPSNAASVAVPASAPAAVKAAAPAAVKQAAPAVVKQAAPAATKPAPAKKATGPAALNAPTSPTDETKVPHYFGPYANWAWSPQVQADAVVSLSAPTGAGVTAGNPLVATTYATDYVTPPGTLAPLFSVLPNATLPAGNLQSFTYWNQGTAGASPVPSAGNVFHAYLLRPDAVVANKYTVIYDSGLQTVPVPTNPAGEVTTVPVSTAVAVAAGDVIGFYGEGIPFDLTPATGYVSVTRPRWHLRLTTR